jgi:two-component sensor histidine kinase
LVKSLGGERIAVVVDAEAIKVTMDQAVQLGIIVNELITNAVKHAYGANEEGEVRVTFRRAGDNLELAVRDFGAGLAANDTNRGLGMKLVRSLVQQCSGVLILGPGPGTELRVKLPASAPQEVQDRLL